MARPRKPLEMQEGDLTRERQEEKKLEQEIIQIGSEQLKKYPSWLRDSLAKKEWKRLNEQFEELGMISNLDYNNIGAYCNAFSSFIEITNEMKDKPFVIEHTNKMGFTNEIANPLIQLQMKYSDEMRKYSSLLGLTIDSRLKIASLKLEKAKNGIDEEFGDL